MHHDDVGQPRGANNRHDVSHEVEIQIAVERGIDRVRRHDLQQCVTIRGRLGDRLGSDVAAGAGAVLNDELLAEAIRQPLPHQARLDVGCPARGKADDDADRPGRIGLRPRNASHGRPCSNTRGQMQECAAGKFHDAPSTVGETLRTRSPAGRMLGKDYTCLVRRWKGQCLHQALGGIADGLNPRLVEADIAVRRFGRPATPRHVCSRLIPVR